MYIIEFRAAMKTKQQLCNPINRAWMTKWPQA